MSFDFIVDLYLLMYYQTFAHEAFNMGTKISYIIKPDRYKQDCTNSAQYQVSSSTVSAALAKVEALK